MIELPSLIDPHQHFRFPGNPEKETLETGVRAALKGGYKSVCLMANTNPVIDTPELLNDNLEQYSLFKDKIDLYQVSSVTKNLENKELVDIENMKKNGAIFFSNDGKGIQDKGLFIEAAQRISNVDSILAAHLENEDFLGENKSEWSQLERDIEIAKDTGLKYHACHISTKESLDIIRDAKKDNIDISVEATPHHLILDNENLDLTNGLYKVNPPLRSKKDKEALVDALIDGTIDMIGTDHAPHTIEEKMKPFKTAAYGFIGSELALPLMWTHFVKTDTITQDRLIELMSTNPSKRFGIKIKGTIQFDEDFEFQVSENDILSKSKNTPFINQTLFGRVYN